MEIITPQQLSKAAFLDKLNAPFLAPFLMKLLRIRDLNRLYHGTHTFEGVHFVEEVLKHLSIDVEIHPEDVKNIPATGGFIAVANHPFGALDGLIMLKLFAAARPDFKIIANHLLMRVANLQSLLIPVNPFREQRPESITGLRELLCQLHNDMPVGVFPAGEVASYSFSASKVVDSDWHNSVEHLIHHAKVPVVPVYFSGTNSLSFNLLGFIHPMLRTAQLPAQLLNKRGKSIKVRIGKPIPYRELYAMPEGDLLRYVRAKTYTLGTACKEEASTLIQELEKYTAAEEVVEENDKQLILNELEKLPQTSRLYRYNNLEVYIARQEQVPNIVREIGRLREITYRAAGEGTNKATDLDKYDEYYHHLFVYDHRAQLLVGAYRLGKGKQILKNYGKQGFYLHSLFKMKDELVPTLRSSVELGRSFVRQEYQSQTLPLLLLWKGIATYLEKRPSYRYLIGPVSISDLFSNTSKILMVDFIISHFYDLNLAKYVRARKKYRYRLCFDQYEQVLNEHIASIDALEKLIDDIDTEQKALPVLLKKYLKQYARIIGFNIDPRFSNSLDGFMIMDITTLPAITAKMLERYAHKQVADQ